MLKLCRSVLLVALIGTVLPACVTDPVTGESVFAIPMSVADEQAQGLSYKPIIVAQMGGRYPDDEMSAYLGDIVLGMARDSARPELEWEFTVLNTSEPNAFAIPGGQVFVTRGLLWRMEDEGEFAVVMGHELGHVERLHIARRQASSTAIGVLVAGASVYAGDDQPFVAQGAAVLGQLGIASYSRDHEREADERGVANAYKAGYDPREGGDVFRMFQQMKEEAGGGGDSLLAGWTSSHPLDSERIENIARLSAETDPRFAGTDPVAGFIVNRPGFTRIRDEMRRVQPLYDSYDAAAVEAVAAAKSKDSGGLRRAMAVFESCARELPGHAAFPAAVGWSQRHLGQRDAARRNLERAASLNQGLLDPVFDLAAMALEDGRNDEAISRATEGLDILPGNYLCHFVRAEALHAAGRGDAARADYQAVIEGAPDEAPEVTRSRQRLGKAAAR